MSRSGRRVAYFDCVSGASGDMLLAALIDAGAPLEPIERALGTLPLSGWSLATEPAQRGALRALRVRVRTGDDPTDAHSLADLEATVAAGDLPPGVAGQARAVFQRLAQAEGAVHGTEPATAALHAVGAADAMIDVVGVLSALALLEVGAVYASALPLAGAGQVESGHGPVPLPSPATLELLRGAGAPLRAADPRDQAELVTPTAAALLAELACFERPPMRIERVGVGAGARQLPHRSNVLRVWLGAADAALEPAGVETRAVVVLETTVDDMTAEQVAFARERIAAAGALDVWVTSVAMKKGRSGLQVTVIARPDQEGALAQILLRETSTLGVRVREERRYEAQRESLQFESSLGPVELKRKRLPGEAPQLTPEFEACRRLAERHNLPIAEVYALVLREAAGRLAE